MKTDYTVVGKIRNHENILRIVRGIENKGYTCYNFLKHPATPHKPDLPWEEQVVQLESHSDFWNDTVHQNLFRVDMEALKNASTVVVLLPAGKAAHMEAGVAYGLGKKLILVGEIETPETLYLMFDEHYTDIESFLKTI